MRNLLPATGLAVLLVLSGCSRSDPERVTAATLKNEKQRKKAPDFALKDSNGKTVKLSDYKGKVVLLNFWATWCGPCIEEMPSMERLHRQFQGGDFLVLGVSVDEEGPDKVMEFANDLGVTFEILHDRSTAIRAIYQTTGVPESFVIDRSGMIVKKVIGATQWDNAVNATLIRRLLDAR